MLRDCFVFSRTESNIDLCISSPPSHSSSVADVTDAVEDAESAFPSEDNKDKEEETNECNIDPASALQSGQFPSARPKQNRSRKRQKRSEASDRELMEAIMNVGESQDEIDLFTKSVGHTMRRLSRHKQAWLKVQTDELLFKAEFGDSADSPYTAVNSTSTILSTDVNPPMPSDVDSAMLQLDTSASLMSESLLAITMTECGIAYLLSHNYETVSFLCISAFRGLVHIFVVVRDALHLTKAVLFIT